MRLDLTARNLEVTPALRQLVTRRLTRVERLLNDNLVSGQVVLSLRKFHHIVDIKLHARGDHLLHGVGDASSWQAALKEAVEKIVHQAERIKGKWDGRKRRTSKTDATSATPAPRRRAASAPPEGQPRVVRARRHAVKPMTIEDAALKVDSGTDQFLVFRNASTDAVNILYRRKDGHLGLIDPEA
jgi:putative sigma-54 modulation protein